MIVLLGVIALWALWAYICHNMAKSRGRDPVLWTILGALFGVVPIIVLALMGDKDLHHHPPAVLQ